MIRILLAAIVFGGCSDRRVGSEAPQPGPAAHPRLVGPALSFGPSLLPAVLSEVRLGMTEEALRAARPRAYASRIRADERHEEIGPGLSAHYRLSGGRLASVLLRQADRAADARRLAAEAERRWGRPLMFMGAPLFRAPGAFVRVETDLGNLILEFTDTTPRTLSR